MSGIAGSCVAGDGAGGWLLPPEPGGMLIILAGRKMSRKAFAGMSGNRGVCYLIGGGPGDPGLLTLRGRECLERADVVFYDYLASERLLDFAPERASRVCVGKAAGAHSVAQEETTRQLVEAVREGKIVARLKGGDPFVFGRGGEEALALAQAGLAFEIVPGITSAIAAAAYAGIPVTHRGLSTAVTLVTGHEAPGKAQAQTDWAALARGGQTLCIYMGMANLETIAAELIRHGRSPNEPVAVIRHGTLPTQRTVCGTLMDIAGKVEDAGLLPPGLIVVGAVTRLRETLQWFETKPLFSKNIVVTRSREQAGVLSELLREDGAQVIEIPSLQIVPVPLDCPPPLQTLLGQTRRADSWVSGSVYRHAGLDCGNPHHLRLLEQCDSLTRGLALVAAGWPDFVVFTSANGVEQTFFRISQLGWDARLFAHCRLAVIGPATAHTLNRYGLRADIVPPVYTGEGLLAELRKSAPQAEATSVLSSGGAGHSGLPDRRFLLLRADQARDLLREELAAAGAMVEDLVAYRLSATAVHDEDRRLLLEDRVDAVTFASSGTVRNFLDAFGAQGLRHLLEKSPRPLFASIGPVTSATMREAGIPVDVEAAEATIPALARAVAGAFAAGGQSSG